MLEHPHWSNVGFISIWNWCQILAHFRFDKFWSVLVSFHKFGSVLTHFGPFWLILTPEIKKCQNGRVSKPRTSQSWDIDDFVKWCPKEYVKVWHCGELFQYFVVRCSYVLTIGNKCIACVSSTITPCVYFLVTVRWSCVPKTIDISGLRRLCWEDSFILTFFEFWCQVLTHGHTIIHKWTSLEDQFLTETQSNGILPISRFFKKFQSVFNFFWLSVNTRDLQHLHSNAPSTLLTSEL